MTITTILSILKVVWLILPVVFFITSIAYRKKFKEEQTKADDLQGSIDKMVDAELKKEDIRSKADETETNIIDNPGADHGVLPVSTKGADHNHPFKSDCTESCPAFNRD